MGDSLRTFTFVLDFSGEEGLQGIRKITSAISDVDEVTEALTKQVGKNTTVEVQNQKTKKEAVSDGRRLIRQMESTKSKLREVNRFYEHQSKVVNQSADSQETLNAVYRLGAHATEKQKQEVTELVQKYQQVRKATDKTRGSFRNLRGVSQNLGWQLQDVAVQAQMGTSAFVIFAQQGSQMASSFGPAGALVGAFIAVAGAIGGVASASLKVKESAELLKETKIDLLAVLRAESKEYGRLNQSQIDYLKTQDGKVLKKLKKDLMTVNAALRSSNRLWNLSGKKLKEHNEKLEKQRASYSTISRQIEKVEKRIKSYTSGVDNQNKANDARIGALSELIKYYSDEGKAIGKSERQLAISGARKLKAGKEEIKIINAYYDRIEAENKLTKEVKEQDKANVLADKSRSDRVKSINRLVETITREAEAIGKTRREIALLGVEELNASKATKDRINAAYDTIEAEAALAKEVKEQDEVNTDRDKLYQTRIKAIDRLIASIKREADSIELSKRQIALRSAEELNASKVIKDTINTLYDEIEADEIRTRGIKDQAKALRVREAARLTIEKAQKAQLKKGDPISGEVDLTRDNLVILFEQKKALGIAELEERKIIDALIEAEVLRHSQRIAEIQGATLLSSMEQYGVLTGALSQIFGQLNGIAEEGSKRAAALFYINQGISMANAIVNTETAATKALDLGPILGIPASQFVRTTGYASVGIIAGQTIAGAYDKGGSIPSGRLGIVSEYGDELVNGQLIKGPARVTSREDTAKMLSGSGETYITIVNSIEGARYRAKTNSNGEIKIIAQQVFADNIDSGVSGVLNNRNSKSTKAMKSKFNVGSRF